MQYAAGVVRFGCAGLQLAGCQLVPLDVLHPAAIGLLTGCHVVGNRLGFVAAIPVGTHLTGTDLRPFQVRRTLCLDA